MPSMERSSHTTFIMTRSEILDLFAEVEPQIQEGGGYLEYQSRPAEGDGVDRHKARFPVHRI